MSSTFNVKSEEFQKRFVFSALTAAESADGMRSSYLEGNHLHATIFSSTGVFRMVQKGLDYAAVRSWLDFCHKHHSRLCSKNSFRGLPGFRLIDCQTRRICLWKDIASLPYVTLSYVWGSGSHASTAERALPESLPATVEDALTVALALGYKYLWIDRYCVPQHNSTEKMAQIQNMGTIYGHSDLTIIAAAGDSPTYGLPGVGSTPRMAHPSVVIGSHTFVPLLNDICEQIDQSTWSQRGWTYQEGLLCKRQLVFTDTQCYFQCGGMSCLENISLPLEALHISSKQRFRIAYGDEVFRRSIYVRYFSTGAHGEWEADFLRRVNEYKFRSLSHDSDALDAFAGILQTFKRRKVEVENIMGVPLYNGWRRNPGFLVAGLLWKFRVFRVLSEKGNALVDEHNGALQRREEFPSWTWVGWKISKQIEVDFNSTVWHTIQSFTDNSPPNSTCKLSSLVDIDFIISGTSLNWTQYQTEILRRYEKGDLFRLLNLTGWTVELKFPKEAFNSDTTGKVSCGPFTVSREELLSTAIAAKDGGAGLFQEGDEVTVTCILMFCYSVVWHSAKDTK